jgi:hypothetical protein
VQKFMNRLAIVSLIALPIATATAIVPAGASTPAIHFRVVGVQSLVHAQTPPNTPPNTKIHGKGATAKFIPAKLTAAEGSKAQCDKRPLGLISFTVTNTGTATAYVYYKGGLVFKLKKAHEEDICASGFGAGTTATLNLGSSSGTAYKAKLKIKFSS